MPRAAEPIQRRLNRRLIIDPSGCLVWAGAKVNGYGVIRVATGRSGGKMAYVHRIAYELANGPIPSGIVLDHLCRNRACANVAHLEAVSTYENIRRGMGVCSPRMQDPDHCANGHEWSPENTVLIRVCRTCRRETERRASVKRRERGQL